MAYRLTGFNEQAAHFTNGVRAFTAVVDVQASLADIDWMKSGSFATDNAMNVYPKDPLTGHWVMPAATPILITTQPANVNTTAGAITESLSVVAYAQDSTGAYTPTYQWYSNNSADYTTPSAVGGATSATFPVPTGASAGTYYYFCVVTANSKTLNSGIATVVVAAA